MAKESALTSRELNYLVFRYLQESGLRHSAFNLGYEAGINKCTIDGDTVPPCALITIVQKGLQYLELEANLPSSNLDFSDEFLLIQPMELIKKDVHELQKIIKDRKKEQIQKLGNEKYKDRLQFQVPKRLRKGKRERKKQDKNVSQERDNMEITKERERVKDRDTGKEKGKQHLDSKDKIKTDVNEASGGIESMVISLSSQFEACEISHSEVTVLEGHLSEVFACAWSPAGSLLASGSGDSTARIWKIPDGPCIKDVQTSNVHVLKHFKGTNEKNKDVTTLDWNGEGTLLATGSYDGQARIWNHDGELKNSLIRHRGAILSLKWNKKGDFLLSSGVDETAIVWDTKTWDCKQQFKFHSALILDVDWRNDNSFATCSIDGMIYVCEVGVTRPIKTFAGHQGEVNAIKWDPSGSLLASCSDDGTAKIWNLKQDKYLHDFRDHVKEIFTIRWSPAGPGTNNPNQQLILASASFDQTIKLWDVEQGRLLNSLEGHRQAVYSVAFSPNGEYLASGSFDKSVHIWSVKQGRILKTYRGSGPIFQVCWNREGDKLAACSGNSTICVMDFRM